MDINRHRLTIWLVAVAIFLVAGDLAYSFYQHSQYPMEGDMEESVLPRDYLIPLYQDPFGVKMLANGEPHAAPNRFFSHYLLYKTYRTVPFALQKAVKGMLPKNKLAEGRLSRLRVFDGAEHAHTAQNPKEIK